MEARLKKANHKNQEFELLMIKTLTSAKDQSIDSTFLVLSSCSLFYLLMLSLPCCL